MKHTFTDSDPIEETAHRADRLFKKGAALASLALIGASFAHNNAEEVDVHAMRVPGHILHDSNGNLVPEIPAERTVTLPSAGALPEAFYPNYVEKPGACQVVDLRLPQRLDYNEIAKGSKTEFALSTERYQQLQLEVQRAESLGQLQKVLAEATAGLNIRARFDIPLSSPYLPYEKGPTNPNEIAKYSDGVQTLLRTLSIMPRQMTEEPQSINFVNTRSFPRDDGFKAGGLWSPGKGEITFPMLGLSENAVVHEFAHAMHTKACEGASDKELQDEYDTIMKYLRSNPRLKGLEEKFWKKDHNEEEAGQYLEYIKQGKLNGIPTDYSRTNYVELMAEMTASMVCQDGLFGDAMSQAEEQQSSRVVREMVLERLQKAMPGVDVPGWMEYIASYLETLPGVLDPKHAIKDRVSPYDSTYAYYNYVYGHTGELKADWKLTPAVRIKGGDGTPDQYIYAYQNLRDGMMDIQIVLPAEAGKDTRDLIVRAAARYIQSVPGYEHKKIDIESLNSMTGRSDNGVELMAYMKS